MNQEAGIQPAPSSTIKSSAQGNYKIPALRVLSEITSSLSSENNLDALLERFLGTMVKLAGADAGAVRVLTADGLNLRLVGSLGLPPEVLEKERYIPLECGVCGETAREHTVHDTTNLKVCEARTANSYFGKQCQRVVAVPLRYQGKMLGVYNLFMASDNPVPEDVSLLFHSISEHLGMALENARLTRENLRITLTNERHMLANELHDSLAQTMAYMKMRLPLLRDAVANRDETRSNKYVNDLSQALESAYAELRELLTQFRNRMDSRGLLPALYDIVGNFYDKTGITIDFNNLAPDINLSPELEVQVYHIVREALNNVSKHSRANHVRLSIEISKNRYVFSVEDNGIGISGKVGTESGMHLGLNIMRERAMHMNAEITLAPGEKAGTRVTLSFPVSAGRREEIL
ncbi:MAG TPA: ATP-binding protein [Sulfuricella sp.]|nr:ATP-binding protein [Sulfuricella sp.]